MEYNTFIIFVFIHSSIYRSYIYLTITDFYRNALLLMFVVLTKTFFFFFFAKNIQLAMVTATFCFEGFLGLMLFFRMGSGGLWEST